MKYITWYTKPQMMYSIERGKSGRRFVHGIQYGLSYFRRAKIENGLKLVPRWATIDYRYHK